MSRSKKRWKTRAALLGTIAAAACASSPDTVFLTLNAIPGAAVNGPAIALEIADLRLPSILDRRDLVRHRAAGEVSVSPFAQWAAPLDSLLRETLSADLAARLPDSRVIAPGEPRGDTPPVAIYVLVHEFAQQSDGMVRMRARWGLVGRSEVGPSFEFTSSNIVPDTTAPAVARAMSEALGQLADAIAAKLQEVDPAALGT